VQFYDGPFAATKELLAGFNLVDAKDLNEAPVAFRRQSTATLR
jgi:hypothetical protein